METGEPIQIIKTDTDELDAGGGQEFLLDKEKLSAILAKVPEDMKVSVVSVVGAFRTGKSFLLTLFLRYLRHGSTEDPTDNWLIKESSMLTEGNKNVNNCSGDSENSHEQSFAWRGGQDRMTTGIWMWSEPFIHYSKAIGKDIAILLMDTQGMFDNETTMALTAQIFGISTLVSSYEIYNVQNSIGEDKLQHLALFSEYGRLALAPAEDDEGDVNEEDSSADKGSAGIPFKPTIVKGGHKPFQHLQFLVRDWTNFETEWPTTAFGMEVDKDMTKKLEAEMKEYFATVIKDRGLADLQSTRDQISRCFETVDAFLLPHPGTAVVKKTFDGSLSKLETNFKKLVNVFVRRVLDEDLEPKRVHTRYITAPELMSFFEGYVTVFKEGSTTFPKAMTMLDATADANNRNAYDLAFKRYKHGVSTKLEEVGFVASEELQEIHDKYVQQAWAVFKEVANMGSYKAIETMSAKLNDDITEALRDFKQVNALRNPYYALDAYAVPIAIAIISWIISAVLHVTCTTDFCVGAKRTFSNVYMYILFIALIMSWNSVSSGIKYLQLIMGNAIKNGAK